MAAMDQVARRLHLALQSGALPPEGRAIGQRLMTQLSQPTRIAVIGLAGAGKTSLVNLILGDRLMPEVEGVSVVELAHGATAQVQLTLADGTLRAGAGMVDPAALPPGVVRIRQELPDPRLTEWSFLEIGLQPADGDQAQLLDWMAKRSDIGIWCSQQFDDRERALWATVPDHLKDHSFLALTRADRLYMKGELAERIARLQPVVADEFLALYPIATLQAAAARRSDEEAALWQSSGGKALLEGLRQQVEQGRMADLDHAWMLLERYRVPDAAPEVTPAAASHAISAPQAVITHTAAPLDKAGADEVMRQALGMLQSCADDLLADADHGAGPGADGIMERCNRVAEDLVSLLCEAEGSELDTLRDDVIEGEQMLMLLRLERGESAAEDSLTVLLQLKKDIAERVTP